MGNSIMRNTRRSKETTVDTTYFDKCLHNRKKLAEIYLSQLYSDEITENPLFDTHDQWNCNTRRREEKWLSSFICSKGIQAWDQYGISVVTAEQLANPIRKANASELEEYLFDKKQIKDAKNLISKLNTLGTTNEDEPQIANKKYTKGIAQCIDYNAVYYIHNNLLYYNAVTSNNNEKYDLRNMTRICAGGESGNNSINKYNLFDLIEPLVGEDIISNNVLIEFKMPKVSIPVWNIEAFIKGNRFMTIEELKVAHSYDLVLLDKSNINVEYYSNTDQTVITIPYLFYVERTEMFKLVVVPTEMNSTACDSGNELQKAGEALELEHKRRQYVVL